MSVKISIITVCYNNKSGLEKTIISTKNQTFKDYEFIVVDGASTDGTLATIEENKQYITSWISEKDNGIYNAMNKGILMAKGEYCLFLNSGDCFADKSVLENLFSRSIEEDIVYGNAIKIKPHYRRVIRYSPYLSLYDFYKTDAVIHHQASFIKRDLFKKIGVYREDIKIIADWEFFFRAIILNEVKIKYIDHTICIFDGKGLSNNLQKNNPERLISDRIKESILKSHFNEYILNDYKKLDKFLSHTSIWQKIVNKISYFRIKR